MKGYPIGLARTQDEYTSKRACQADRQVGRPAGRLAGEAILLYCCNFGGVRRGGPHIDRFKEVMICFTPQRNRAEQNKLVVLYSEKISAMFSIGLCWPSSVRYTHL